MAILAMDKSCLNIFNLAQTEESAEDRAGRVAHWDALNVSLVKGDKPTEQRGIDAFNSLDGFDSTVDILILRSERMSEVYYRLRKNILQAAHPQDEDDVNGNLDSAVEMMSVLTSAFCITAAFTIRVSLALIKMLLTHFPHVAIAYPKEPHRSHRIWSHPYYY